LYALRRKNYAERAFKLVDSHGSYDQQYLRGNPKIYFFEEDGISLTGIVLYNDKNLGWYYVSAQKSQHVLPKTDKMYQEALALKGHLNKNNLEDAIQRIASIHWWMIQALPFNGGAAGITDMLTKTLFKHLGIQTSKWRPGIAPDLEALTTPLEEYVHNYPTFFQKPLELAQND
jgi:hypothetical protein